MLLPMSWPDLSSISVRIRAKACSLCSVVLMHIIARRFLRLHKWIDNFGAANEAMTSTKDSVPKLLETAKFSFFGLYFLMEMFTITDVMGLTKSDIGPWLVVESNRMWFIGLVFSILHSCCEGLLVRRQGSKQRQIASEKPRKGRNEREKQLTISDGSARKGMPYKQLVIDSCDLVIPGAVIEVIAFSPLSVGIAMALSTVLQISDMWPKIQGQATSQKK